MGAAEPFSTLSGLLPRALLCIARKYSPIALTVSMVSGAGRDGSAGKGVCTNLWMEKGENCVLKVFH